MKKVLLLHGWFATPNDAWFPWLQKQIEKKGYEVLAPQLKDKDKPTLERWIECALKATSLDRNTIVIGHSLGAVLGLRLAELYQFNTLITVSGWDFWDLTPENKTFFKSSINHKKIIKDVSKRAVIHSNNDPFVTKFIAEEFSKRIKAKFILVPGKGHFDKVKTLPEILQYIV